MSDRARIRLDLDERRTRGVHAAIREALDAKLLTGEHLQAAREVLKQLDDRVPGWLKAGSIGGEAGYLVAADAVLRALVDAEDRGRRARRPALRVPQQRHARRHLDRPRGEMVTEAVAFTARPASLRSRATPVSTCFVAALGLRDGGLSCGPLRQRDAPGRGLFPSWLWGLDARNESTGG